MALAAAAVLVLSGVAVAASGAVRGRTGTPARDDLPPATATVRRGNVVQTQDVTGTVGYGPASTITARATGTVTEVAAEGATVTRGHRLYAVDNVPVFLLYGRFPLYRVLLDGDCGPDVAELERNLSALGHGGFTVDDRYTAATAAAVREWQDGAGLPVTGVLDPGDVAVAPAAVRIGTARAHPADQVAPGRPVLSVTGTARRVSAQLDVNHQRYAHAGSRVDVRQPDGSTVRGTVTRVGAVAHPVPSPNGQASDGTPRATVTLTVSLPAGRRTTALDGTPVTVHLVAAEHRDVLTVPVAALLALREGGYGIQVVAAGRARTVPVSTGLFGAGRVEVSGPGIAAGTVVGVPAS